MMKNETKGNQMTYTPAQAAALRHAEVTLTRMAQEAALRYAEALVKYHATRRFEKSEVASERQMARDAWTMVLITAEDVNQAAECQAQLTGNQIVKELA
jgi:hypothetical protein